MQTIELSPLSLQILGFISDQPNIRGFDLGVRSGFLAQALADAIQPLLDERLVVFAGSHVLPETVLSGYFTANPSMEKEIQAILLQ